MSINKLVQKLEARPKRVDEHWAEKRLEWIADVDTLMASIKGWLQPAVDRGLARVEQRTVDLEEPDTGPYTVAALTIELGDRPVRIEPRGMRVVGAIPSGGGKRVVGARGRVDLISGPARATILRNADRSWLLAAVDGWPPEKSAVALTEETLTDALSELIDG